MEERVVVMDNAHVQQDFRVPTVLVRNTYAYHLPVHVLICL